MLQQRKPKKKQKTSRPEHAGAIVLYKTTFITFGTVTWIVLHAFSSFFSFNSLRWSRKTCNNLTPEKEIKFHIAVIFELFSMSNYSKDNR